MSWVQGDWLGARARLSPERTALIDAKDGRRITFAEWNRSANRTAHWLRAEGVQKGDRVAVCSKNRLEILDLWFACGKLGAVLQMLNFRLTEGELRQLLRDPKLLIRGPEFEALGGVGFEALRGREALPDTFTATPVAASDPWVICYTGGSTGLPKGALLTHGSIFAN